jgi:hypothetical protein
MSVSGHPSTELITEPDGVPSTVPSGVPSTAPIVDEAMPPHPRSSVLLGVNVSMRNRLTMSRPRRRHVIVALVAPVVTPSPTKNYVHPAPVLKAGAVLPVLSASWHSEPAPPPQMCLLGERTISRRGGCVNRLSLSKAHPSLLVAHHKPLNLLKGLPKSRRLPAVDPLRPNQIPPLQPPIPSLSLPITPAHLLTVVAAVRALHLRALKTATLTTTHYYLWEAKASSSPTRATACLLGPAQPLLKYSRPSPCLVTEVLSRTANITTPSVSGSAYDITIFNHRPAIPPQAHADHGLAQLVCQRSQNFLSFS